jgi:hypothetical protein
MACDQPSILPQIVVSGAALAGVLIGLLFSVMKDLSERKHQRRILLRGKYEELALSLCESVSHLLELQSVDTIPHLLLLSRPVHAQKIDILARLYFPELIQLSDDYLFSVTSFQNSLAENYDSRSSLNVGEQGAKSEEVLKIKDNLMTAKHALDEAIDKYAEKYASS